MKAKIISKSDEFEYSDSYEAIVKKFGNSGHIIVPAKYINNKVKIFISNIIRIDNRLRNKLIRTIQKDINNRKKSGYNFVGAIGLHDSYTLLKQIKQNKEINKEEISKFIN